MVRERVALDCDVGRGGGAQILGEPFAGQAKFLPALFSASREANPFDLFILLLLIFRLLQIVPLVPSLVPHTWKSA